MSSLSDTLFDGLIRKLSSLTALDAEDVGGDPTPANKA